MSKRPKKMLNAAINTDSALFDFIANRDREAKQPRLKERDVKHIKITQSSVLLESYDFGEQIGKGNFGTVISVKNKVKNKDWAMKIVSKSAVGERLETLQREIQILKMVDHPHIIYLDRVYETTRKIYLVMERCYGELARVYKEKKKFSEGETRKVIRDLASAVAYLHKNDIVHRDLKLENILMAQNPEDINDRLYIKVSDFGLSIVRQGSGHEDMLHDCCGTLMYMAPEMTTHSYSQLCDVWAIGVIMYMLVSGRYPFYSSNEQELTSMIRNEEPSYSGFEASSGAIHLLTKMLCKNPALRIAAAEVIHHPWIVGKPLLKDSESLGNVLDMMRLWRSEMLLPVGEECDWMSSAKAARRSSTEMQTSNRKSDEPEPRDNGTGTRRQSMVLPVKNIRFDKADVNRSNAARSNVAVGLQDLPHTSTRRDNGGSAQTPYASRRGSGMDSDAARTVSRTPLSSTKIKKGTSPK